MKGKLHDVFIDEYMIDRNATQAAIRAGYSPGRANRTGYELMHKPKIIAAIAKLDKERQERYGIDADFVVARLLAVYEKAFHGAPKMTREGQQMVDEQGEALRTWSPAGSLRALEALMKLLGLSAVERREVEVTGDVALVGSVVYTLQLDRELPTLEDDIDIDQDQKAIEA